MPDTHATHKTPLLPLETGEVAVSLAADDFKGMFRGYPAGVAVVTADRGGTPAALTVTSLASVSAEPPLMTFSVSDFSSSAPAVRGAETVVIHLLSSQQLWLAQLCATSGVDRFADPTTWSRLPTGEPYFPAAAAWIRARVVQQIDAGTATILLVHAREGARAADADLQPPLVYHARTWHGLGDQSAVG